MPPAHITGIFLDELGSAQHRLGMISSKIVALSVALGASSLLLSTSAFACGEDHEEKKKDESVTSLHLPTALCGEDHEEKKKDESVSPLCGEDHEEKKKEESVTSLCGEDHEEKKKDESASPLLSGSGVQCGDDHEEKKKDES